MKTLLLILNALLYVLILFFVQCLVSYVFPYPLNYINTAVVGVSSYLILRERRNIVWYMLAFFFLTELISPVAVFGSIFIPGTLATLLVYWCHRFFFTNRSMYTGIILGAIMLASFRLFHILYSWVGSVVMQLGSGFALGPLHIWLTELLTTEGALIIVLFVLLRPSTNA